MYIQCISKPEFFDPCFIIAALKRENFYFINFQYLCKTEEGDYLPVEIAVVEYSIEKGITKKLHRFIEPGNVKKDCKWLHGLLC